jgi:energy-converting hydrogenase Eha subunit F
MPECQICGREIKASKGLIAHHGYSRPYQQHFQTSSCFGARYQPYEIAHDAIDKYLAMLAQWIVDATAQFDAWKASPPKNHNEGAIGFRMARRFKR